MSANCLSPSEEEAVHLFQKEVRAVCNPHKIVFTLFGSRSRGEGNEDSDMDILVLLPHEDHQKKVEIWDIAHSIFTKTNILISPLVLSKDQYEHLKKRERLIAKNIEAEGISL